jgi:hypothetical protein
MNIDMIKAVTELNDLFYGEAPMDFAGFEYRGTGYLDAVFFMGVRIWTDDDDTRYFDEYTNEYESFKRCFSREAINVLDKLNPVKRYLNKILKEAESV